MNIYKINLLIKFAKFRLRLNKCLRIYNITQLYSLLTGLIFKEILWFLSMNIKFNNKKSNMNCIKSINLIRNSKIIVRMNELNIYMHHRKICFQLQINLNQTNYLKTLMKCLKEIKLNKMLMCLSNLNLRNNIKF